MWVSSTLKANAIHFDLEIKASAGLKNDSDLLGNMGLCNEHKTSLNSHCWIMLRFYTSRSLRCWISLADQLLVRGICYYVHYCSALCVLVYNGLITITVNECVTFWWRSELSNTSVSAHRWEESRPCLSTSHWPICLHCLLLSTPHSGQE